MWSHVYTTSPFHPQALQSEKRKRAGKRGKERVKQKNDERQRCTSIHCSVLDYDAIISSNCKKYWNALFVVLFSCLLNTQGVSLSPCSHATLTQERTECTMPTQALNTGATKTNKLGRAQNILSPRCNNQKQKKSASPQPCSSTPHANLNSGALLLPGQS